MRGQQFFFYWRVKLKRKITLTKERKNKKNEGQVEKNNTS